MISLTQLIQEGSIYFEQFRFLISGYHYKALQISLKFKLLVTDFIDWVANNVQEILGGVHLSLLDMQSNP